MVAAGARSVTEVLGAGSDRVDQSQGRSRSHAGDLCLIAIKQAPVFGPGHTFQSPPPNAELSLTTCRTQIHREHAWSYPSVEDFGFPVTAVTDHKSTTITRAGHPGVFFHQRMSTRAILFDLLFGERPRGRNVRDFTLRLVGHQLEALVRRYSARP